MKLLHKLSIDEKHFVLVFDNNSPSNYNRFIAVVPKTKLKDYLTGCTMKTSTKKEYKEQGVKSLENYKKEIVL